MKLAVLSFLVLLLCAVVYGYSTQDFSQKWRLKRYSMKGKKDDFVDAEIVGEDNGMSIFGGQIKNSGDGKKSPLVQGLLRIFGQDEKSIKRREQEKQLDTMIDKVFEGSGLLGMGMKGVVKGVAKVVASSMSEAIGNSDAVLAEVNTQLRSSSIVKAYIGEIVTIHSPMSTMSSSMNINGNVQKGMTIFVPVMGRLGGAMVRVVATCGPNEAVDITQLFLQTDSGEEVLINDTFKGRGGGPGSVIDV